MCVFTIPTWRISFLFGSHSVELRVPDTEFEAMMKVLRFNNAESINAEKES